MDQTLQELLNRVNELASRANIVVVAVVHDPQTNQTDVIDNTGDPAVTVAILEKATEWVKDQQAPPRAGQS